MVRPLLFVVEDAPDIVRIVEHLSRRADQEVVARGDVPSAWQYLEQALKEELAQVPDLILLDVQLPGITGLELYRTTVENAPQLTDRFALFCQWSLPDVIARGLEDGIDFVVAKDLLGRPDAWRERIEEILSGDTGRRFSRHLNWQQSPLAPASPEKMLGSVQESFLHPNIRYLGDEVLSTLVRRSLGRCTNRYESTLDSAERSAIVNVLSSPNPVRRLALLQNVRPDYLVMLNLALSYQAEGLLGWLAARPICDLLVAATGLPANGVTEQ